MESYYDFVPTNEELMSWTDGDIQDFVECCVSSGDYYPLIEIINDYKKYMNYACYKARIDKNWGDSFEKGLFLIIPNLISVFLDKKLINPTILGVKFGGSFS